MEKIKGVEITDLDKFSDERGCLVKLIKKEYVGKKFGEIYLTSTKPGFARANHYHKKTTEWFCVVQGKCLLLLRDLKTKQEMELILDGNKPQLVKVPALVEHTLKNIGNSEALLFAYADEPYEPSDVIPSINIGSS